MTAASFGKMPTTSVRRLISLLSRSSGLFDQIWRQWLVRECQVGEHVGLGIVEQGGEPWEADAEAVGDLAPLLAGLAGSGWAKTVRIVAATISAAALGTSARAFRMKWTRQRCQLAPWRTAAIAALQALVGVADHQLDPAEATSDQAAQELVPEGPVLARPDVQPQHLALAVAVDADRDHHRHRRPPARRRGPSRRWRPARHTGRRLRVAAAGTARPPRPAPRTAD